MDFFFYDQLWNFEPIVRFVNENNGRNNLMRKQRKKNRFDENRRNMLVKESWCMQIS